MSSSDWDEIKRLAADFQRAQLSTSYQKLSERNCIEIINKLVDLKLIDIYFTTSGKEYLTPSYLSRQIKDELFVHGGRISLTDLSTLIEVNLEIIEKEATSIAKRDSNTHIILGQLVNEDYLDSISEEINEKLQIKGFVTIGDVAQQYDFPADFLLSVLTKRLGKIIQGKQDDVEPHIIYTNAFVLRHEYQIRGIFSAITHPVSVGNIITNYGFQERLFFATLDKYISADVISGSLTGGRVGSQAVFVPSIYSKSQFSWVENFLKQNGFLEFRSLNQLGISDPVSYIKKNFKSHNLTFVPGACVSKMFIDQISVNIDDALANDSYIDILPFLPSVLSGQVCSNLINMAIKNREASAKASRCSTSTNSCHIFCESIVVSQNLLTTITLQLEELMSTKAKEAIAKGAFKQQLNAKNNQDEESQAVKKKEDRRKKATGGKTGGGTQGRETKTKSTKNKGKGRKAAVHSDDDDDFKPSNKGNSAADVEFLSFEEMADEISRFKALEDCPEELITEIVDQIHESVSKKFQEVLRDSYYATVSAEGDSRRKNHQQLQEKVIAMITTVRLAEKSLKEFSEDTKLQLAKYLLRSHCSEIVDEIVLYLADDSRIDLKDNTELSPELRLKIINQLDNDLKKSLTVVNKTLSGSSVEEFMDTVDDAVAAADIIYKKKDNKRDKQILLSRRTGLIEQLNASLNYASCLHLSCLVLFQTVTGNILHASGKFVPQVLAYLQSHVSNDFYEILREYQNLVMESLKNKEGDLTSHNQRLEELTPKLKENTASFKKQGRDRENSLTED